MRLLLLTNEPISEYDEEDLGYTPKRNGGASSGPIIWGVETTQADNGTAGPGRRGRRTELESSSLIKEYTGRK